MRRRYADTHGHALRQTTGEIVIPTVTGVIGGLQTANLPFDQFTRGADRGAICCRTIPKPSSSPPDFSAGNITQPTRAAPLTRRIFALLRDGPRADHGLGVQWGPDHELQPVPRSHSSIPSTQPRLLPSMAAFFFFLPQHHAGRPPRTGKREGHRAPILVVPTGQDRVPPGRNCPRKSTPPWTHRITHPAGKKEAGREFKPVAGLRHARAALDKEFCRPGVWWAHVPLNEGEGTRWTVPCAEPLTKFRATGRGVLEAGRQRSAPRRSCMRAAPSILASWADFEKEPEVQLRRPGSRRAATGGVFRAASKSRAWMKRMTTRGWDFVSVGPGASVHIVSKWPDDALKVSTRARRS